MTFSVTINGHTWTDADFAGFNYITSFPSVLADVASVGSSAATSASQAAAYAAAISGTSTTSMSPAAGSKTFTTQSGKQFAASQPVYIASAGDATQWMYGTVASYSDTTLIVTVTDYGGASTKTDWNISPSGIKGAQGVAGTLVTRVAATGTRSIGSSDNSKLISCTNSWTLGTVAAATAGAGFWCYVQNAGTGDITVDPNSSETIDGLTSFVMYPGEVRLVTCDGSVWYSAVVHPFSKTFTSGGTFTTPPGYSACGGLLWGGGGSGARTNVSTALSGGGGGGACVPFVIPTATLGTSQTITIGASVAGKTTAVDGASGNYSSIGTLVYAYGGAGGTLTGSYSAMTGGAGGGALSAGSNSTGYSSTGGGPGGGYGAYSSGMTSDSAFGGSVGGGSTMYGGASGGGANSTPAAVNGGASVFGGGGGGGGKSGTQTAGASKFGGAGGAGSEASSGTDGTAPGGGGGGTNTGTTSGAGARGELRIWGIV